MLQSMTPASWSPSSWTLSCLALISSVAFSPAAFAGSSCSVPGTHASLASAVSDVTCSAIALDSGDFDSGITIDRSVAITGMGETTRLISLPDQINLLVNAGTLTLSHLVVVVPRPIDLAIYTEQGTGAALSMDSVSVRNAEALNPEHVFASGFEF